MDHLHPALIALEALIAQVNQVDESNNNNPGVLLQNGMWVGGEIHMVGDGDEGSDGSVGLAATLHSTFAVGALSSPHNDAAKVSVLLQRMDLPEEFERTLAEIAMLCATLPGRRGREFKDELRRQGAIERWVTAAGSHGQHHSRSKARNERIELFNALARAVYDHRANAVLATELGLLKITAEALHASDQTRDDDLSEFQLCCANNICGMVLTGRHHVVLDSGIIPVLIRYAGGAAHTTTLGQHIATAALANLSNTGDLCQALIRGGAVEVLSAGLLFDEAAAHPTIGYMQCLSAVVKTVGRGVLMGGMGSRFSACTHTHKSDSVCPAADADAAAADANMAETGEDARVFHVNGLQSSRMFQQSVVSGLLVDLRSAKWMLEYLSASCDGRPYPRNSNIYGTAWKVAQSVACIAHGSAQNRTLLNQEGVWKQLTRTLLRDYDHEGRLHDEEERRLTEIHVVYAMRKMLRGTDDVSASAEALTKLNEPFLHFRLKLEGIAAGRTQWSTPPMQSKLPVHSGMKQENGSAHATGRCMVHTEEVREVAAELLLSWGKSWEIERLIWLTIRKPSRARALNEGGVWGGGMGLLTPSMVRRVMKFVVMGAGKSGAMSVEDAEGEGEEGNKGGSASVGIRGMLTEYGELGEEGDMDVEDVVAV